MAGREYEGLLDDDEDDEDVSRHLSPLCDPTHLLHRIVVLIFMCFLGFGKSRLPHESRDQQDHSQTSIQRYIHTIECVI